MGKDARAQVEQYVAALFAPTDLVEVRLLPSRKQSWVLARDLGRHAEGLAFANRDGGQNVYVGVNPRMREGGDTTNDVALARCLFVDRDDCTPDDAAAKIAAAKLPTPTLLVSSGHGVHGYWRLVEPMTDLSRWTRATKSLIARAGGDKPCHDPPRILRLPGFLNVKDEPTPCEILSVDLEVRYAPEDVAGPEDSWPADEAKAPPPPASALPASPAERYARLSRATLQFLAAGGAEGERQTKLFHAACDMAGNGIPFEEAKDKLVAAAMASGGKDVGPAIQGVESAYSRPRAPAVPLGAGEDDAVGSAFQHTTSTPTAVATAPAVAAPAAAPRPAAPAAKPAVSMVLSAPTIAPAPLPVRRIQVSNVIDSSYKDGDGNDTPVRYYVNLPEIARSIGEATEGWPRRAGGMLFAVRPTPPDAVWVPTHHDVQWVADADDLFAWMGRTCDVRWAGGDALHHETKKKLNPPTKREMFAYLKDNANPTYRAVEVLPHHPPVHDLFYLPCRLPPVATPEDGKPTPLQELVNRLNPETEADRRLMLAALLTPGWGGPPGARPAFVFTSEHGRGVGKSATATVLAEIWGGAIGVGAREDWDKVRGRLLGDDSLAKRIVFVDNVKGKFQGGDVEGMITAPMIDGWKPYFGQASRPNFLTWYLTANAPSLSRDIADRSVIIKVGRHRHSADFVRWAGEFTRVHRAAILAELLDILRGDPMCAMEDASRDRWGAWQDAVLSRFEDGNELAALIKERRPAVDADLEDAAEIAQAVEEMVAAKFQFGYRAMVVRITRKQLQQKLVDAGIIDRAMHPKAVTTLVKDKLNTGPLTFLTYGQKKVDGEPDRFWFYHVPDALPKGLAMTMTYDKGSAVAHDFLPSKEVGGEGGCDTPVKELNPPPDALPARILPVSADQERRERYQSDALPMRYRRRPGVRRDWSQHRTFTYSEWRESAGDIAEALRDFLAGKFAGARLMTFAVDRDQLIRVLSRRRIVASTWSKRRVFLFVRSRLSAPELSCLRDATVDGYRAWVFRGEAATDRTPITSLVGYDKHFTSN